MDSQVGTHVGNKRGITAFVRIKSELLFYNQRNYAAGAIIVFHAFDIANAHGRRRHMPGMQFTIGSKHPDQSHVAAGGLKSNIGMHLLGPRATVRNPMGAGIGRDNLTFAWSDVPDSAQ